MHSYYSQQCTISKCYIFGLFAFHISFMCLRFLEILSDVWIFVIRLFGLIFCIIQNIQNHVSISSSSSLCLGRAGFLHSSVIQTSKPFRLLYHLFGELFCNAHLRTKYV